MSASEDDEERRIRTEDLFNAFVKIRPDPDPGENGPIAGATIAVKDNIAVAGMPFTAGHPLFAERIAETDAEVISRLRSAGGRVIGVTRTDAGGFGVTTPAVINPRAPELTAGGSSGGAAAAVAGGLAWLGLGTDTGGSVRIPAACCGLFGFKPTFGRELLEGVWPLAPQFDHVGILAQDIALLSAGAAAMLAIKADVGDPVRTVGFDAARFADCTRKTRTAVARVIETIKASGYEVKPVTLPDRAASAAAHSVLVLSAALATYAKFAAAEIRLLAETAQKSLAAARKLSHSNVAAAKIAAARATSLLDEVFAHADVILMPTLLVDPPPRGASRVRLRGRDVHVIAALVAETCLANLTGCPALSIPIGAGDPIPASIQLLAARGDDMRLLAFARELVLHLSPKGRGRRAPLRAPGEGLE